MLKHVIGCFFGLVAISGAVIFADPRDDFGRAKSDFESLRSRHDMSKSRLDSYLEASVKLRSFDKDQLAELVTQICRLDIEEENDEADRIAKELQDRAVERVRREYDNTVDAGSKLFDELGRVESDGKSLHSRVRDLEHKEEIKDESRRLREELEKLMESNTRNFEKINADRNTLDRVNEGIKLRGANNPLIRARMEFGKEMHEKLQRKHACHEKEITLSSGRPDCILFDAGDCKVIEFKPDTYSIGDAERQAKKYLDDVRARFKNDERAKQCKQDSDGPIFKAVGETYPACRP